MYVYPSNFTHSMNLYNFFQATQPSKDVANLQRRNDELANEVRKLTKQVTSLSGNKTSLSTENRSLQERTKRLEETVTQVQSLHT